MAELARPSIVVREERFRTRLILPVFILGFISGSGCAEWLTNPGFEELGPDNTPAAWTVLTGLDAAGYGPAQYDFTFAAVRPTGVAPGRGGRGRALGFPIEGTWRCGVAHHSQGVINGETSPVPGSSRGKAAAFQVVSLPPGKYRFGAYLRTAEGDCWSGSFSLGVAANGTTQYAHDASTGIVWSDPHLAMRGDPQGDYPEWGEWQWHTTEPFTVTEPSTVSVWIRFNYVNEHQMNVRWEADDAAIERILPSDPEPRPILEGSWQDLSPPRVGPVANFQLGLTLSPAKDWRRLEVRFRHFAHEDGGYILSLTRDGRAELRSVADGPIRSLKLDLPVSSFALRLVARGQYFRADFPGERGFEARIIGPREGFLSIGVDPPGSASVTVRATTAPASLPDLPFPIVGEFVKVYDPSVGEEGPWYINDHCVIRDATGTWHMFGITHAEPFNPPDEDFFAHAANEELIQSPWKKLPHVCHVNESEGETHVWAPHIVEKDGMYYMFYCAGGEDGDAYQINLRTSTNLNDWQWYDGNPLCTDIGNARDPMVLELEDGRYLMYYTRPSDLEQQWSSVAVRESEDLIHWSEAMLALVTHEKQRFGRHTESPFVFRHEDDNDSAYYLSATGLGGGYRNTAVWRSLDPYCFDPDHIVARIDAHAPEWIRTDSEPPASVTHCGWKQGGLFIAPVRWERRPWSVFGLLVVRDKSNRESVTEVTVRRRDEDRHAYRTFHTHEGVASYPLPPGKYRVNVRGDDGSAAGPFSIEVVADERTYLDL